jgi:hypothetical protein
MNSVAEELSKKILTAMDRCDQCGSQAYYLVVLDSGELMFCRHHFMQNEKPLRKQSHFVLNQSDQLIQNGTVEVD